MRLVERKEPILFNEGSFSTFYSISPDDPEGAFKAARSLQQREFQRDALADALERYNSEIGNDSAASKSIERFREKTSMCVFSGQQLGLFGGPAYTVLKAVSCLILARKHGAVPIFWLATEDHDVDEIDHTFLVDNLGNLNKFHLSLPKDGRFVENLLLHGEDQNELKRFCRVVDQVDLYQLIRNEKSYSAAMAKVMAALFKGTGLVFLEPRILRPFAKDFFKKEISDCDQISQLLLRSSRELSEAGGEPALDVSEGSNLFIKMKGSTRRKILRSNDGFRISTEPCTEQYLIGLVENEPERFSTNAAARCVLQNLLFPVFAYAAGPGELAYYRQLKEYHSYHGISMPWIFPRLSMTLVPPVAQEMLEKIGCEPWEQLPAGWTEIIPAIEQGGEELTEEWVESASRHFGNDLSSEAMRRFVDFQSKKLKRKAVISRLRKEGIAPHSLHYLNNILHPHEKLQERVINWWEFQSHVDYPIIKELLEQLDTVPKGHLYCLL